MTLVPPSLPCACWQMRVGEWVRRRSRYIFLTLWATTSPSCGARRVHPERARPRRLASVAAIDRRRRRRTSPRRRQPPPPFESASVGGRVAAAAAARGGAADERAAEAAGEREGGLPFGCSPRARPRRRSDRRRRPSQPSASAARGPQLVEPKPRRRGRPRREAPPRRAPPPRERIPIPTLPTASFRADTSMPPMPPAPAPPPARVSQPAELLPCSGFRSSAAACAARARGTRRRRGAARGR